MFFVHVGFCTVERRFASLFFMHGLLYRGAVGTGWRGAVLDTVLSAVSCAVSGAVFSAVTDAVLGAVPTIISGTSLLSPVLYRPLCRVPSQRNIEYRLRRYIECSLWCCIGCGCCVGCCIECRLGSCIGRNIECRLGSYIRCCIERHLGC